MTQVGSTGGTETYGAHLTRFFGRGSNTSVCDRLCVASGEGGGLGGGGSTVCAMFTTGCLSGSGCATEAGLELRLEVLDGSLGGGVGGRA